MLSGLNEQDSKGTHGIIDKKDLLVHNYFVIFVNNLKIRLHNNYSILKMLFKDFLAAQWLRLSLPMKGCRFEPCLGSEDATNHAWVKDSLRAQNTRMDFNLIEHNKMIWFQLQRIMQKLALASCLYKDYHKLL